MFEMGFKIAINSDSDYEQQEHINRIRQIFFDLQKILIVSKKTVDAQRSADTVF